MVRVIIFSRVHPLRLILNRNSVTANWIDEHTYIGREDQALKVVLVAAELQRPGVNDASLVLKVDCGFGYFRVCYSSGFVF